VVSLSHHSSKIRNVFEPLDRTSVTQLWLNRFGIAEHFFSEYQFFKKGPSIWAAIDVELPRLSYEALGMRIMNMKHKPWKPTTSALQIFGKHASKNLVHLDKKEAMTFLTGDRQTISSHLEPGYVVVFYRGEVLGCGLYSNGKLASQIPKERRMAYSLE
jgi:NOL1/NOP2/fmu family ribosome biogenesis protein